MSKNHAVSEPPERLQVAVVGPGKLGRACALALLDDPELVLAGVVERAGFPGFLRGRLQNTVRVTHIRDLPEVDLALVCVPPLEVGAVAHDLLQSRIPMVECARLEGGALKAHYQALEEQAHRYRATVVYGAGWNPGVLPLMNSAFHVLIPQGRSVAHRHPAIQMHHSVSVGHLPGVKQALEGEFSGPDGQSVRYVYVELMPGAAWESVRSLIESDPLFAGESTRIFQMDGLSAMAAQERQGMVLERLESTDAGHHASLLLEARFDVHQFAARAMVDAARRLKSLKTGAHPYTLSLHGNGHVHSVVNGG